MCLSKLMGGGGGGAPPQGPPAPPHAMALISITLFGKRIKNSFFLSQMYSLLSKIPFLFFFLLFFSLLLKIFHFSFSTLNSHGMVPGLVWNPGTFKCSFFLGGGAGKQTNPPSQEMEQWETKHFIGMA